MVEINADKLHELVRNSVAYQVEHSYGAGGADVLRGLLSSVRAIFTQLDIEHFTGELLIFRSLRTDDEVLARNTGREVLRPEDFIEVKNGPVVIEATADGRHFLWSQALDGATISDRAIVYKFREGSEWVYARAEPKAVDKLAPSFKSMFAIPSFSELTAALDRFKLTHIKSSTCKLFTGTWRDEHRLFFKNGPEHIMRDSLCQFLRTVLQDADVLPEQNVDDTQPIDIKVAWRRQSSVALIEIKWLGKSKNDEGRITVTYGEARAKAGAQQLVDYLEAHKPAAAEKASHGYLVVIDGRRHGLGEASTAVTRENGLHYEAQEIIYDPVHLARPDFKTPTRMFAQPVFA